MQLLEKDPEKRPQSATVVLQALESIEAASARSKHQEPTKDTAAPLPRTPSTGGCLWAGRRS